MRNSLRAHVSYLESTIRSAQDRLTQPNLSADEVQDLELQLTLAQSALEHYRKAYELELSVSGPEPPDRPDTQSKDGAAKGKNGNGERKKEGLTGHQRARKRAHTRPSFVFGPSRARV